MNINFLHIIIDAARSAEFLLVAIITSFIVKLYFLKELICKAIARLHIPHTLLFLIATLAGSLFGDIAWSIKLLREIFYPQMPYHYVLFWIRIAWAFLIVQYQSLGFFMQSLTQKNFIATISQKITLMISTTFAMYFLYLSFFDVGDLTNPYQRKLVQDISHSFYLEPIMMQYTTLYLLFIITIPNLYFALNRINESLIPKILRSQLRIFIYYLLCPYLFTEFLLAASIVSRNVATHLYPIVTFSTALLIYAIYYCITRVMKLRFLNFTHHIEEESYVTVPHDFSNILDQLMHAHDIHEIKQITQTFFKERFNIPMRSTIFLQALHYCEHDDIKRNDHDIFLSSHISEFMVQNRSLFDQFIKNNRLCAYDDITFSTFYEDGHLNTEIIKFLESIDADIFIPLYTKQDICAYIIIPHNARTKEYYTKNEQDEMFTFGTYLANVISLLLYTNEHQSAITSQKLFEQLYKEQNQNRLYKESFRHFLRNSKERPIGIILYKNRHFIYANPDAHRLMAININTQEGHHLTKACRRLIQNLEIYKTAQREMITNDNDTLLVLHAFTHTDYYHAIITVSLPDVSDIINQHNNLLKDPSNWNLLLPLSTTKEGVLIQTIIPGEHEFLINKKIELLKAISTNLVNLLCIDSDDVPMFVEMIHHISNRQIIKTIDLSTISSEECYQLFFGSSSLSPRQSDYGLLEKLDGIGTICIRHIDRMSMDMQEQFARYLEAGYKNPKKNDRIINNIRILCTSERYNLSLLVQEGTFSEELFHLLQQRSFTFNNIATIQLDALKELMYGFAQQIIKSSSLKNILRLSDHDIAKIISSQPSSLYDIKMKVQHALVNKSKKQNIYDETYFDPAYQVTDPELFEAARLGKNALKDPQIMSLLWQKFKNQNRIAVFLGVNRSSVNRRCKEYNLIPIEEIGHES